MEKELEIKTEDGFSVFGNLSFAQEKSDKLIVFVHGFTGHKDEHIFFNGAKFFNENGFDAFRFDLYSDKVGARRFFDTKISQHGQDINSVIDFFKDKYKSIYIAGHSFGGTSLLFMDQDNINALIFWDASYIDWKVEEPEFVYSEMLDKYVVDNHILVGKGFVEELKNFPDCGELVSKIHKPIKFIVAEIGANDGMLDKYMEKANEPKESVKINNSDHCFNSFEAEKKLFDETLIFVKKY
jgi:esterase/lipase